MTERDFAFWLQGFLEVSGAETITAEQLTVIRKHLNLVFVHSIDPSMGDTSEQDKLNKIHGFTKPTPLPHFLDPNADPHMRC